MPEGRRRFESGYGPPGGLPGGHNPKPKADPQERYITRILVDGLYGMHLINTKCFSGMSVESILSARWYPGLNRIVRCAEEAFMSGLT